MCIYTVTPDIWYTVMLYFYFFINNQKQPVKLYYLLRLSNLLNNFSAFPGFHNIYFTTKEHQRRKEASEEKEVFVHIIWHAKRTKKALVFIL